MAGLLKVTEEDWKKAEEYFKAHPNEIKTKKREDKTVGFSFVKIDGEIYARKNGKCLNKWG